MMNEIKEYINNWRNMPHLWVKRLDIVNSFQFDLYPMQWESKIPVNFIININKLIQKFYIEEGPKVTSRILKEKNKVSKMTLFNFKVYCKSTVIQIAWHWWTNRQTDQKKRIKSQKETQTIIDNWSRTNKQSHYTKALSFQLDGPGNIDTYFQKKEESKPDLTHLTKINTNGIIDPKVKYKTIKLLKDNTREKSRWPWVWGWLSRYNTKATSTGNKSVSWIALKWKTLWKTGKRMRRQTTV